MYSPEVRRHAVALMEQGISLRSISMSTGISRATLHDWREHPVSVNPRAFCPRCAPNPVLPEPQADYAYLLGLYLGDGCISLAGARDKRVWKLRIACADAWPGLIQECARAMIAVRPYNKVFTQQHPGCTEVVSTSRHWPCLFPQHGPGRKHLRRIELESWQRPLWRHMPGTLPVAYSIRTAIAVSTGYEHVSLTETTGMSIRAICSATSPRTFCGCAGRRWTGSGWCGASHGGTVISVARREAVARLDEFVGPKY